MITCSDRKFSQLFRALPTAAGFASTAKAVFLVAPDGFRLEPGAAVDNAYMDLDQAVDIERAQAQFQQLALAIRKVGVPLRIFPGDKASPDAVFPNNVFATVPGRLIVGAMYHPARQLEANSKDVRRYFSQTCGYETVDLSQGELIAELTGSLVIDRAKMVGYCGISTRADEAGCAAMADAFGLRLCYQFDLAPSEYHTNVLLSVLAGRACVAHPGSFADPAVPMAIGQAYADGCVVLSDEEKDAFVGNCIALTDHDLFMSATAERALRDANRRLLTEKCGFRIHSVAVDEFEKSGGSLRCMVAEIF